MNTDYWALKSGSELANDLMGKVDLYYEYLNTSGKMSKYRKSYRAYYGLSKDGRSDTTEIGKAGTQDELSVLKVNHTRNLTQHLLTMVTSQRPALEPRATNTDHKSQAQTVLASGLLDYYMREKRLEKFLKLTAEFCLVFDEGFIHNEWDATSGQEYGVNPETQAVQYEGDIKYSSHGPLDVIRDIYKNSDGEHDWIIVRNFKNKYDLAAKYPELAEEIIGLDSKIDERRFISVRHKSENSDIPIYTFYYRKSDALPQGRAVTFLSADITLIDGPLPYREIPVFRMAPSDHLGTIFGYTPVYDLLGVQQAIDSLYSAVTTNQTNFGVQNIVAPKGHDLSVTQLSGGLNLLEYDPKLGPIQALNLTSTPPEIFNFIKMLEQVQETLSGVNSVSRGNPEASLKSGAALALVASQAIQFSSGLQQSYYQLMEMVGTSTINILRDFAAVPRVAYIVGKHNRPHMKQFKGDDLSQINRVVVEVVNPVSKTPAGRMEMAKDLLQSGLITKPEQYISVITTGRLEPLTESDTSQLLRIRAENEMLSVGKKPVVLITDRHDLEIKEHLSVLDSPEARENPGVTNVVLSHVQEHINAWKQADPVVLAAMGMQPAPQAPVVPPQGGPQGTPENMAPLMDVTNPVVQEAQSVRQPNMPKLPKGADPQSEAAYQQLKGSL